MMYAPISDPGYWQMKMEDITLNGKSHGLCDKKLGCQAVVDTGSSLLMGPAHVVNKIENILKIKKNCTNFDQLPNLEFKINNHTLSLTPDDYMDHDKVRFHFFHDFQTSFIFYV